MRREQFGIGVIFHGGAENGDGVIVTDRDYNELVTACYGTITAPSAKKGYQIGATYTNRSTGAIYVNTGTTLSCTFTLQSSTPAASVTGAMLTTKVGYFTVSINTNGTTPVNVFGAGGAPVGLTVTNVTTNSQDTTAGNVTIAQTAGTIATIAKGATSGGLVGGASLANTTVASAAAVTVVSSSAGNAIVTIGFTVA